jgi:iron complex transport system permease protein
MSEKIALNTSRKALLQMALPLCMGAFVQFVVVLVDNFFVAQLNGKAMSAVSFVGLIAPHIAKQICKSESHVKILFPSILWGIFLCVTADLLAHNLIPGITLQVNAICAIIGAPILIYSFSKKHYQ